MKPSEIVAQLNRYVIGQDEAKKILAVAVYAHFRKVAMTDVDRLEMLKSNILLIGPTGTGKTLLCETLARILELPFVTADATSLAQTEYVNEELDSILQRLLERAGGDPAKAGRGIVFIDEVDKLKAISGQARAASGENVQHALLKIMEGLPSKRVSSACAQSRISVSLCRFASACRSRTSACWRSIQPRRRASCIGPA